jgi:hypothetical protein
MIVAYIIYVYIFISFMYKILEFKDNIIDRSDPNFNKVEEDELTYKSNLQITILDTILISVNFDRRT